MTLTSPDQIRAILPKIGVTRLADVTELDVLGIPVVCAVAPASNDMLSVYSGKGVTREAAEVSAIMEAFERFCSSRPQPIAEIASVCELRQRERPFLDPATVNLAPSPLFSDELPIAWLTGTELFTGQEILVPYSLATHVPQQFEVATKEISTTNGLASGSSTAMAENQAMLEIIERDDWTMAAVECELVPRITGREMPTAPTRGASIEIDSLPADLEHLCNQFRRQGIHLDIKLLSSEPPTSVIAVSVDRGGPLAGMSHLGLGCHDDPEVAVRRAVTEVAQARAVDIQGAREDIEQATTHVHSALQHTRRTGSVGDVWPVSPTARTVRLTEIRRPVAGTDQRAVILEGLRLRGLDSAVSVNLSLAALPGSAVRVIVPHAETWIMDKSLAGRRMTNYWNKAVNPPSGGNP